MERSDEARLAVLIDADNTSAKWADAIFEEIATLGEASVRRIYGDFSGPQFRGWEKKLAGLAVIPYQQFAYTKGKNSSAGNNAIDPPRYPDRSDPPQPVRVEEQLTYAQRGTVAPV